MTGEIEVVRYKNLSECMDAFFDGHETPRDQDIWEWWEADGTYRKVSHKEAMQIHEKRGCWAFVADKEVIHIWVNGAKADLSDVLHVLAHELGHIERPHHRTYEKEEIKANRYADLALKAFDLAVDLTKQPAVSHGVRGQL